ncbi:MAG TPA: site-specific integrase [Planctomycetota bacterium]|nr:site-specific integrase [Planctomycetota bacterium]
MNAGTQRGRRPLAEEEIRALDAHFAATGALRDRAWFTVGHLCGFRIRETLSLRLRDVVDAGRIVEWIHVSRAHMKGRTQGRTMVLHPVGRRVLAAWVEELRKMGWVDARAFVFQSTRLAPHPEGHAITSRQALRVLHAACAACGIPDRLVGTHSLRKTFAMRLKGVLPSVVDIQGALGHQSLNTTQRYLSSMPEDVFNAVRGIEFEIPDEENNGEDAPVVHI